jgi:pimeloyl-ACP methyl ester carboxylesterase
MTELYSFSKGTAGSPPVILIHGLLGSARNLTRLADGLAVKGFHVVAYDQRGHGRSPWSDDYSLSALASDVFQVMDSQGFKKAHLVGHSLGARVSLAATAARPERVLSLAMLDAGLRTRPAHLEDLHQIIDPLPDSYPSKAAAEAALASHSTVFRQFLLSNLRSEPEPPHTQRWVFDLAGVRRELLNTVQVDQSAAWSAVKCPALVVRGEHSESVWPEDLGEMRRLNPRAEIATIAGAAHWLHVDNFQSTLETVERFLLEHK